jgi:hypothetical protein
MAGTINYLFDPNQDIFAIVACNETDVRAIAVRPGRIIRVRAEVLVTTTTLLYDVQVAGESGSTELPEADIFTDIPSAVAEYEIRLT